MKTIRLDGPGGILCLAAAMVLSGCATGAGAVAEKSPGDADAFKAYWYQGKAELARFELQQSRYGEIRNGDAVLIFVTEDFLPDRQVKYEHGRPSVEPASVLKLNFTRKFDTGIYPYSMMTSVFTPVAVRDSPTMKVTTSVQEWCGHTYTQLNRRDGRYRGALHSYFQDEADQELDLKPALLEDEIWTRIRLDPESLPVGEVEFIPGLQYARLAHRDLRVEKAVAKLTTGRDTALSAETLKVYRIEYRDLPRTLEIRFESVFPYAIVAWQEEDRTAKGAASATTRAVKTHSILLDYWNKNSEADAVYRKRLGLD